MSRSTRRLARQRAAAAVVQVTWCPRCRRLTRACGRPRGSFAQAASSALRPQHERRFDHRGLLAAIGFLRARLGSAARYADGGRTPYRLAGAVNRRFARQKSCRPCTKMTTLRPSHSIRMKQGLLHTCRNDACADRCPRDPPPQTIHRRARRAPPRRGLVRDTRGRLTWERRRRRVPATTNAERAGPRCVRDPRATVAHADFQPSSAATRHVTEAERLCRSFGSTCLPNGRAARAGRGGTWWCRSACVLPRPKGRVERARARGHRSCILVNDAQPMRVVSASACRARRSGRARRAADRGAVLRVGRWLFDAAGVPSATFSAALSNARCRWPPGPSTRAAESERLGLNSAATSGSGATMPSCGDPHAAARPIRCGGRRPAAWMRRLVPCQDSYANRYAGGPSANAAKPRPAKWLSRNDRARRRPGSLSRRPRHQERVGLATRRACADSVSKCPGSVARPRLPHVVRGFSACPGTNVRHERGGWPDAGLGISKRYGPTPRFAPNGVCPIRHFDPNIVFQRRTSALVAKSQIRGDLDDRPASRAV